MKSNYLLTIWEERTQSRFGCCLSVACCFATLSSPCRHGLWVTGPSNTTSTLRNRLISLCKYPVISAFLSLLLIVVGFMFSSYLSVYGFMLLAIVVIYTIGFGVYVFGSLRASRSIHQKLIDSVLGTTLRFVSICLATHQCCKLFFVGGWTRPQHPESSLASRRTFALVRFSITLLDGMHKSHNFNSLVDGPVSLSFSWFIDVSASMLLKFFAVVFITPGFTGPGVAIAILGGWLGRVYMRAQIAIKREMSNAKAPVLGHFGASVAGLSASTL